MPLLTHLINAKMRLTPQRKLIVQKIEQQSSPFSAEDLYTSGLKRSKVDLATIYRSLNAFHTSGWLVKTDLGDGRSRYWFAGQNSHAHTLYCRDCHKIELITDCLVGKQHDSLLKQGFTQLTHKVEFVGVCPECSEEVPK